MARQQRSWKKRVPDMENTMIRISTTGKDIMTAAQDVLKICKAYAETAATPAMRSKVVKAFSAAITTADEFGKFLVSTTGRRSRVPASLKLQRAKAETSSRLSFPRRKKAKASTRRTRSTTARRSASSQTRTTRRSTKKKSRSRTARA